MNLYSPCIGAIRRLSATAVRAVQAGFVLSGLRRLRLRLLLPLLMLAPPAFAQSVLDGTDLYKSVAQGGKGCVSCHAGPSAGATNNQASNNPSLIFAAIANQGAPVFGAMNGIVLSDQQALSLALRIGQHKLPIFTAAALTMTVRSGTAGVRNIYGSLVTDGSGGAAMDSGGLTVNSVAAVNGVSSVAATNGGAASVSQSGATSTMNYNIHYTSPAQFAGTDTFTVNVVSALGASANKTMTVTVLGISNVVLTATGFKGTNYVAGVNPLYTATCSGCAANSFSVDPATPLPPGMAISPSTGQITGIPTTPGTYPVTLRATSSGATHSGDGQVTKDVTITVAGITSANPPNFLQDSAIGTYTVTALPLPITVGSYTMSSVPAGLSFNTSNGQLTGIPTHSGTFNNITFGATTAAGAVSQGSFIITVASAGVPNVITSTPALPVSPAVIGEVGTPLAQNYQVNANRPPISAYPDGGLAATGLTISGTGLISGTPTLSGDFPIILRATNSSGTGSATSVMVRVNPNAPPVISGTTTVTIPANQPYAGYQIQANNLPITGYSVVLPSVLPDGLSLNANGLISGTPTASGQVLTTLRASNVKGDSNDFILTFNISPSSAPAVTSNLVASPLVTGTVNSPITAVQINATNPPITAYGSSGLPPGLSINGSGQIVGTPSVSGDFTVTVNATNSFNTGQAAPITIRINPNVKPAITSANTVSTNVNQAFAGYQIVASNAPITAYAVVGPSALPTGLTLSGGGFISGTPTASGIVSTTLRATNLVGNSDDFVLTFTIVPTAIPVVSSALVAAPTATGTVNVPIAPIQISATNPPILSYGSPSGLPPGLSINGSGQIVGTPTTSGDFVVTLSATNAAGPPAGVSSPITVRINPNTVPAITSLNTATGLMNTVFGGYQILTTNVPILSYAVLAPSVLPAGLTLNTSSGAITGTPTASGLVTTNLTATNAAGTSVPFALSFTINPSSAPGITSPTFANFAAGVAITPVSVVATNPVISAYAATNLPPGLAINTTSGVISGTPTTPGLFSATLSATNVFSTGSRVVPFTITVPTPAPCALSVPVNTPGTLNVATCLINGFAPTGATIVSSPGHGVATTSGPIITYTPALNYFGGDSFTYVASGAGGTSPQGIVTITVTGRPDPTKDLAVVAVAAAQVETAQRFSRAQLSNFQRRMEALHRPPGADGAGAGALQGAAPAVPGAAFAAVAPGASFGGGAGQNGQANLSTLLQPGPAGGVTANAAPMAANPIQNANAIGAALALPRTIGAEIVGQHNNSLATRLEHAAQPIREAEALNALVSGTGLKALPFADSVISLIKSRSVDLASIGTAAGLNTTPDKTGKTNYWIEGVASFGTRDASGGFASSEFASNGISIGVDQRINEQLAWGMGLGYGRDKTTIGTDGSLNRARGYSLAVYGSYQVSPNTYLDGLLGVGVLDFDSTRFVAPVGAFAVAERNGTQVFGSLTGGYEFRDRNTLISPYGRFDFASSRLGSGSETGAGAFALTYFDQTTTSVQGALGVRAESVHATRFGYAIPRVRAELRHEFKGNSQAFVGYADGVGGRFAIASAGGSRDSITLGLGSEFLMRDGLSLSLDYQLNHSFGRDSSYAVRLRLSKDFDARGLPKLRLAEPDREEEPLNIQFDAGYTTDDNVTRAKAGPDRLHDDLYSFNLGRTFFHNLSETSRLLYGGTLGGQKFHRFNGLSNLQAGLELEYQYRASSEFDEPTYGAFAKLTGEAFESALRDGYRLSTGVSVRLPLSDRIGLFAAVSYNLRDARSDVFSTRDKSLRGNLDYALSDRETLYLGADFRYGDILSTGRASLENVTIAKLFVQDDAYAGGQLFSYKVDGRTVLLTAGYNLSFGAKDSIDFSWRHVRATPGLRPAFVTGPRSYKANQLSAVYLLRF